MQLVAAFVAEVRGYKAGDPMDEATYLGAITRRPQIEVLKRQVAGFIGQSRAPAASGKPYVKQ